MNLRYRATTKGDLEWLREHHNDPSTCVWLGDSRFISHEEQLVWFRTGGASHIRIVEEVDNDGLVSPMGLLRVRANGEVGADIIKSYRGRGLGHAVFQLALQVFPTAPHWLYTFLGNHRAMRIYTKAGFIVDPEAAIIWRYRQFPQDSHPEAKAYVRMYKPGTPR